MPLSAISVRPVSPRDSSLAHAFLSPIFGALFTPVLCQVAHTASTTSLPPRSPLWALAVCAVTDAAREKPSIAISCFGISTKGKRLSARTWLLIYKASCLIKRDMSPGLHPAMSLTNHIQRSKEYHNSAHLIGGRSGCT